MRVVASAVGLLALAAIAHAHDRSASYSHWVIDGRDARVELRISALDASWIAAEASPDETPAEYFARRLELHAGGSACALAGRPIALAGSTRLAFEWHLRCPVASPLALRSRILAATVPGHLHFAHVEPADADAIDLLLTSEARRVEISTRREESDEETTGLVDVVRLGIHHVITGYDHLAFLAALLLGAHGVRGVLAIVTAFTIGHSVTLALAVLGHVAPDRVAVEALIGLSIAWVAVENLAREDTEPRRVRVPMAAVLAALAALAFAGVGAVPAATLAGLALLAPAAGGMTEARGTDVVRPIVALLFGLVHGFGFAGMLSAAHFEGARLGQALVAFNVGVELGQLAVVSLLAGIALLFRRVLSEGSLVPARSAASTAFLALGVAWYVLRAY